MIGSELGEWCGVGALFDNALGKLLDENRKFHIKIPYRIPTIFQHLNSRRFKENIPVFQGDFGCLKSPILQNLLPDSREKSLNYLDHDY